MLKVLVYVLLGGRATFLDLLKEMGSHGDGTVCVGSRVIFDSPRILLWVLIIHNGTWEHFNIVIV